MPFTTIHHRHQLGDVVYFRDQENNTQCAIVAEITIHVAQSIGNIFYYKIWRPGMELDNPYSEEELSKSKEELEEKIKQK